MLFRSLHVRRVKPEPWWQIQLLFFLLNLKVACHGEGSLENLCWGGTIVGGNDTDVSIYGRNSMIYTDIGRTCLNRTECMYWQDTFQISFDIVRASFNLFLLALDG